MRTLDLALQSRMKFAAVASLWAACGAQTAFTATRLRVEYLPDAITIDVATPKFSYALSHPQRNQAQTSYHIVVQDAKGNTQVNYSADNHKVLGRYSDLCESLCSGILELFRATKL